MSTVIGLTGGIATGKSTASAFFKKEKIPVIDADAITHQLYGENATGSRAVKQAFGAEYLDKKGRVDRQKLGQLVFNQPAALQKLDRIIHPLVVQELKKQIKQEEKNYNLLVIDVPLLFESGLDKLCDAIIVISLPEELQVKRLMERNQLTKQQAITRINSQMPLSEKEAKATYVVSNTGTIEVLEDNLSKILFKIEAGE